MHAFYLVYIFCDFLLKMYVHVCNSKSMFCYRIRTWILTKDIKSELGTVY